MTNINEIRARRAACADLPWSCACVSGEQLDALLEEVERMRGELATLIVQADEVVLLHREAREARAVNKPHTSHEPPDAIERGEHRREENKP